MSPRLVSPSGSRLREPPNSKQAIARLMSKNQENLQLNSPNYISPVLPYMEGAILPANIL